MRESWVELLVTLDEFEADMIRDLLESGGIAVKMMSAKVTPYPVNVGRMGEVRLLVPEQDRDTALEALRQFRQQNGRSE